ncbi:MAG: NAD(P)/FAD-dependent oxidoreductase, partial [Calditrichaeota bacterium]
PCLWMTIPTLSDPSLAPPGKHLLNITMQYAPYHLRGEKWENAAATLRERILTTLESYLPGIRQLILHEHLITPEGWEERYGLTGGHIYHGEMGLDQLAFMRPVAGWGRYRTPVAGLYLCGAGTHPGGGVTGAPGYNAVREVLRDLR